MAQGQIVRSQANTYLNQLFRTTASNGTVTYHYIGLVTEAPDVEGGNLHEPNEAAGYARRKLDAMGSASDGQIQNEEIIFMGESIGEGWGTISHFIVSKSATIGSGIVFWAPLNESKEVPAGYVPIFRKGALVVGLDKDELDIATS